MIIDFTKFHCNKQHEETNEGHTNIINNASDSKSMVDKLADDPSQKLLKQITEKNSISPVRRERSEQRRKHK